MGLWESVCFGVLVCTVHNKLFLIDSERTSATFFKKYGNEQDTEKFITNNATFFYAGFADF